MHDKLHPVGKQYPAFSFLAFRSVVSSSHNCVLRDTACRAQMQCSDRLRSTSNHELCCLTVRASIGTDVARRQHTWLGVILPLAGQHVPSMSSCTPSPPHTPQPAACLGIKEQHKHVHAAPVAVCTSALTTRQHNWGFMGQKLAYTSTQDPLADLLPRNRAQCVEHTIKETCCAAVAIAVSDRQQVCVRGLDAALAGSAACLAEHSAAATRT